MAESIGKDAIRQLVRKHAAELGVPYDFALAILETESSYRPNAVSKKGAQGLYQLMPATAKSYGVTDPFDPEQNIRGGITFLAEMLRKYGNDQRLVAAGFNAGEKVLNQSGTPQVPSFPETQKYLVKVNAAQERIMATSSAPAAQQASDGETYTRQKWVYPTQELKDAALAASGEANEDLRGHPQYQGVLINYQWPSNSDDDPRGWQYTDAEAQHIHAQLNPPGMFTREDLPAAVSGAVSLGGLAKKFRNPFTPWGLGLMGATGLAGFGTDLYKQSLVPRNIDLSGVEGHGVSGVEVVSWPRSTLTGLHYEGAPDTMAERLHSAAIEGGHQMLGEAAGGALGKGVGWLGNRLFRTGFEGIEQAADKPGLDVPTVVKELLDQNAAPTAKSLARVGEAASDAMAETGKILQRSEGVPVDRLVGHRGERVPGVDVGDLSGVFAILRKADTDAILAGGRQWGFRGAGEQVAQDLGHNIAQAYQFAGPSNIVPLKAGQAGWLQLNRYVTGGMPTGTVWNKAKNQFEVPTRIQGRAPATVLDEARRRLTSRAHREFTPRVGFSDAGEALQQSSTKLRDRIAASLPEQQAAAYRQNLQRVQRLNAAQQVLKQTQQGGRLRGIQAGFLAANLPTVGLALAGGPTGPALASAALTAPFMFGRPRAAMGRFLHNRRFSRLPALAGRAGLGAINQGPGYTQGNPNVTANQPLFGPDATALFAPLYR